ncbi:MAG: GntR family transcriptional regulator [Actinobacteria bacterium]|jgi:DNA-binding GntR family transcriptional regulator|nr:GntR family transcriptional regulator [Actinomycetota bacterium]
MAEKGMRQSEHAYAVLKRAILTLDLPPGEPLSDSVLVERYGVGRTPLREALQRLVAEELVVAHGRRGMVVSSFGAGDIQALFELRVQLDGFAAGLAAQRATEEDIARLDAICEGREPGSDDPVLFDELLHDAIARASHNQYLMTTLRRLYDLSVRMLNLLQFEREPLEQMHREHEAVVDAIKARDPKRASASARRHVMARNWFPTLAVEDDDLG